MTITLTNGDEMQRVRTFEIQYPYNKVQQMGGARGRAYAIDGRIWCPFQEHSGSNEYVPLAGVPSKNPQAWGEGDDVGAAGGFSGGVRRWLRRWKMILVVLMIYGSVWRWRSIVVYRLSWPDIGGGTGSLAGKRRGAENDI
ncbi:hypothetical protein Tco_1545930 [Tanacetum coccineum]